MDTLTSRIQAIGTPGIGLAGRSAKINRLLYADDLILIAKSGWQLQQLVDITAKWTHDYQLEIHPGKTEVITLHTNDSP